jgi:hypothetical protein
VPGLVGWEFSSKIENKLSLTLNSVGVIVSLEVLSETLVILLEL